MGKDNRARRAAKQRTRQAEARRAEQRSSRGGSPLFADVQDEALALAAAARAVLTGRPDAAEDAAFAAVATVSPRRAQQVMVDLLADALGHVWRGGWQPQDLAELALRRLGRDHVGVLDQVHAHALEAFASETVDPRWLDRLPAVVPWAPGSNALEAWQVAGRKDAVLSIAVAVEVLALLMGLGSIEVLSALPGTFRAGAAAAGTVDQKILTRVRALLAKAESTEFDEEAEALSAKAQELMTRYSLDRLLVEAVDHQEPVATAVRIWLETPYLQAKALLVGAVGRANRCSAVWSEELGFVTVIGDERDLVATELLVTSLLVQGGRAMLHASAQSRDKRSFRQSFLVAYAQRVGERLEGAAEHVAEEVGAAALVPVLAAHHERVEQARAQMFPSTRARSVTVGSAHGYAAGRAAADLADLGAAPRIAP